MTLLFGLKNSDVVSINQCFEKYTTIKKVVIYGSRAKGNYKHGSDIDLTIIGSISFSELMLLENQLDDLLLPYKIDLSIYDDINNPLLIQHIKRVGKVFYCQNK